MSDLVVRVAADLAQFRENMKLVDNQIDTTASALRTMSAAYDGSKTIANANAAVIAIDRMGGVSKLTDEAQAKLNAQLNTAISTYERLGQQAPATMLAMRDATQKVEAATAALAVPTQSWTQALGGAWTTVAGFAGTLGIGLGVSALIGFGKSVIDTGSQINDMSTKLGASTDFVQRMSFAAKQTGATMEDVSTSLGKMNANLGGGSTGTIAALKGIGLEFDQVRAMRPEEAFLAIAEAIHDIPDPMTQARVAVELFGKSGQILLPAIKEGLKELGEQATIMSGQTIKSMDDVGDSVDKLKGRLAAVAAEGMAPFFEALNRMYDMVADFSHLDVYGVVTSFYGLKDAMNQTKSAGEGAFAAIAKAAEGSIPSLKNVEKGLRDAFEVLAEFDSENKENEAQIRKGIAAYDAYRESVKSLSDQWTGAKLAERVKLFTESLAEIGGASKVTAFEMAGLVKQIDEFVKQGAALSPALNEVYRQHLNLNAGIDGSYSGLLKVINSTAKYKDELFKLPPILTDVRFASETVAESTDKISVAAEKAALTWSHAMDLVRQGQGTMSGEIPGLSDFSRENHDRIQKSFDDHRYFGPVKNGAPDFEALGFAPEVQWRADGGPVSAGSPYMVGERGPELFVPSSSGSIVPNGASVGGLNLTVNITQPLGTPQAISSAVSSALMQTLRGQGARFGVNV